MALRLVALIPADEKFLAKEIFSQAVFNPEFIRWALYCSLVLNS
jgi:hypothetical protein